MYCPNCGTEVATSSKFCHQCGANIKARLEPTPPRVEKFAVSEVILSRMLANVKVTVGNVRGVKVTIEGDEEIKQNAMLETSGNALKISAPLAFRNGTLYTGDESGYSGNISIRNGQVSIDGSPIDMERTLLVEVEVPKGTTIKAGKVIGKSYIGDTEGDLYVRVAGTGSVSAGRVKSANLRISGSGDLNIRRVNGRVDARVSGAGNINIEGGYASKYSASVSGAGNVNFQGVAEEADLSISGMGNIYLAECKTAPNKSKSGMGSIRVGRAPSSESAGFDNW